MSVWDRVAELVTTHPKRVLLVTVVPMVLPLLALPSLRISHDTLSVLPESAESVQGYRALAEHLPAGETSPIVVVIDGGASVFDDEAFHALGDLSRNLRRLPTVASVRSAAMPTDGQRPEDVGAEVAAETQELADGLREAAAGADELADGLEQVSGGLAAIDQQLPASGAGDARAGLDRAAVGAGDLAAGLEEGRQGVGALRAGVAALRTGTAALGAGLQQARGSTAQLRADVAVPADAAVRRAAAALEGFTIGALDPRFPDAAEALGEAFGRITGTFPPGHPQAGQRVQDGYDGLVAALEELGSGLDVAVGGIGEIDVGLVELDAGLVALDTGLADAVTGAHALRAALAGDSGDAEDGLADLTSGLADLAAGIDELRAGVGRQLLPGARELQAALDAAAADVEESDLAELQIGTGPFVLTPAMLDAQPELREALGFFVAPGETRTRILVGLDADPFSDEALSAVSEIRTVARTSLLNSPLADATVVTAGAAAFLDEVDRAVARDFPIIVAAVTGGVLLVLILLLRSLVAPVYMMATVLLSYGAALGVTTVIMQGLLGVPGLQWYVPSLLFVLLVALGVDYNIFLMGRVREEAETRPTREAVAEGIRHTGRIITSAGVILAGTFSVLLVAPLQSLTQLGLAAAVGILLDTFVVRALVVPSLAVLLGRWNWWPSARSAVE